MKKVDAIKALEAGKKLTSTDFGDNSDIWIEESGIVTAHGQRVAIELTDEFCEKLTIVKEAKKSAE